MTTKTMEGLIGARTNMELVNTPMRVFKEARLKGDTAKMERAMGYVNEFEEKAYEYKNVADEGMKEDAKEAREKAELEREKTIQKRKEAREKFEEQLDQKREEELNENGNTDMDIVEVSEEGKELLKNDSAFRDSDSGNADTDSLKATVTYTKTGEVSNTEQEASVSILI